jgi:hypothetical protein
LEVYGNESAWGYSIWDYFNPSADQVLTNCEKVRDAIFALAGVLLDEPGEPLIVVPRVVSGGVSTLVSVYIDESLSGFETLFLEYRFNPVHNLNWMAVPLIHQGGNRYDALVPAPALGGTMELHVYGQDYAGHTIYSDSVFYTISTALFFGQIVTVVLIVIIIVVLLTFFIRRFRRQRTYNPSEVSLFGNV